MIRAARGLLVLTVPVALRVATAHMEQPRVRPAPWAQALGRPAPVPWAPVQAPQPAAPALWAQVQVPQRLAPAAWAPARAVQALALVRSVPGQVPAPQDRVHWAQAVALQEPAQARAVLRQASLAPEPAPPVLERALPGQAQDPVEAVQARAVRDPVVRAQVAQAEVAVKSTKLFSHSCA